MTCSQCAAPLPADSLFCNRCGAKQGSEEPSSAAHWVVIVLGAVLFTGVLGAVLASGRLDGYLARFDDDADELALPPKALAKPTSSVAKPSSDPIEPSAPADPQKAFTINLSSKPAGASIKAASGEELGQTPASLVLPETTIVELSLEGFTDTCRFELSAKLRDQTLNCSFRKPSADAVTTPIEKAVEKSTPKKDHTKRPSSAPSGSLF